MSDEKSTTQDSGDEVEAQGRKHYEPAEEPEVEAQGYQRRGPAEAPEVEAQGNKRG